MTEFVSAPFYSTWEVYGLLFVTDHKNPFAASNLHVENSNDDTEKVSEKNQNGDCIPRGEVGNHGRDNMDYIESVRDDDDVELYLHLGCYLVPPPEKCNFNLNRIKF